MDISSEKDLKKQTEQILNNSSKKVKNTDFDLDMAQLIYRGVRSILEKDQYNVFSTKAKLSYDRSIKRINSDIDKMIKLNTSGKNQGTILAEKLAKLKNDNTKKLTMLKEKLV